MPGDSQERRPLINRAHHSYSHGTEDGGKYTASEVGEVEGFKLYGSLAFPMIALSFVALDVTMVSTVSATIASEFSSLAVVSWLGSAYLVAVAAVQPISGKLTNSIGRRTGFFWALFFFGAGNLMCGLAANEGMLIGGRVLSGAGGGAISSIGVFIQSDLLPLRRRALWQSSGNIFWATGMGLGSVLGGFINDKIGWRWAFLILVPCTFVVAVCAYFSLVRGLPRPYEGDEETKPSKSIDIVGSILLSSALICFVLSLNLQEQGKNRITSLILLIVSAVLLVCFLVAEIWFVVDPVIPIHLLANRSVAGACLSGFFISVSMYSLLFYVPILIQIRGYSTSQVGLQLLGNPLGSTIGPFLTGLTLRIIGGYGIVKPVVLLVYIAAPLGFYLSTLNTPAWATVIFMALLGAGFGSILTTLLTGLLANIDDRHQATGTGMQYAFRQTGASAGLAVAGIIFRSKVEEGLGAIALEASRAISTLAVPNDISSRCQKDKYVHGEAPQECRVYYEALHVVFLFCLVTAVAGLVFGMMVKNRSLDRDGGEGPDDGGDEHEE